MTRANATIKWYFYGAEETFMENATEAEVVAKAQELANSIDEPVRYYFQGYSKEIKPNKK